MKTAPTSRLLATEHPRTRPSPPTAIPRRPGSPSARRLSGGPSAGVYCLWVARDPATNVSPARHRSRRDSPVVSRPEHRFIRAPARASNLRQSSFVVLETRVLGAVPRRRPGICGCWRPQPRGRGSPFRLTRSLVDAAPLTLPAPRTPLGGHWTPAPAPVPGLRDRRATSADTCSVSAHSRPLPRQTNHCPAATTVLTRPAGPGFGACSARAGARDRGGSACPARAQKASPGPAKIHRDQVTT